MALQLELPLFPLGVVLFQNGMLPLHIFEPRYINMIERVIETESGFGVVLLKEGSDVHQEGETTPPTIYRVGTLASVQQHRQLDDGRFYVLVEGGAKFTVETTWECEDHLRMAQVRIEEKEPKLPVRQSDTTLVNMLQRMLEAVGITNHQEDTDFADASFVSLRLSEHLPLDLHFRQQLLELNNSHQRLDLIWKWLRESEKEGF